MTYYANKNGRKTPFADLDREYLEDMLVRFRKSPRGQWEDIIIQELRLRDRILKLDKIIERLN